MAIYQILVRNLEGRTRCLRFASREVSSDDVKAELAASEGVPAEWQRLVSGTRELASRLVAGPDGLFPSCTLLLRLRGGKGGFGSLLRGAATKAGQKKTSNFDACRDMSGRRLRHVNAEKKLKEWKAEAKDRELEKTAEDFLKQQRKTEEEDNGVQKDLEKFRKESLRAREEIGSAVMDGLAEAVKLGVDLKRKKVEAVEFEVKRARTWSPDGLDEEDDEEDSDDEDEAGPSSSDKDEAGPSSSAGKDEANPCTSGEAACYSIQNETGPSTSYEKDVSSERVYDDASREDALLQRRVQEAEEMTVESPTGPAVSDDRCSSECSGKVVEEPSRSSQNGECSVSIPRVGNGEAFAHSPRSESKDIIGALDFEDYNTSKHLEVLGLERLKTELQSRGLKCGGSLSERAARLFLLKTTPLEKLDKKFFLKPPTKPARK